MIVGDEKSRISPNELGLCLNNLDGKEVKVNEDHIVKSMNFKKTYSSDDATRIYEYMAKTYFDLFEWDKWNDKMNEILINHEQNNDELNQAEINKQIGNGYLEIQNLNKAKDFLFKAATFYNEVGNKERKQNNYEEALN